MSCGVRGGTFHWRTDVFCNADAGRGRPSPACTAGCWRAAESATAGHFFAFGRSCLFIAKFPREAFYLRRKPCSVRSPAQRAFDALPLGASGAQCGVFQKETVIAEARARRAETGVGRVLGMFHFLNRCVIGAQAEPPGDFAQ